MGVETYCVIPRLFGLGPSMVRAVEWEQKDRDVPEKPRKGHFWNTTGSGEDDVEDSKETGDGTPDNLHNIVVEVKKKFDEAREKERFPRAAGWGCSQGPCEHGIVGRQRKGTCKF